MRALGERLQGRVTMTPAAERCIALVLSHEGGYSDDPRDPGNWSSGIEGKGVLRGTKFGIAASAHPEITDIAGLQVDQARSIIWTQYWPRMHGDDLPLPLAMVTLDAEVMSGLGNDRHLRAAYWLQMAVGAHADGDLGPETISEAQACADLRTAVREACSYRLRFLKCLPIWPTYEDGWTRRVNDTQAQALAACPPTPSPI